jgi:hypothetical protein
MRMCREDNHFGRVLDSREPRCQAIVLAGQQVPTGWHQAPTARPRSTACFDSLGELAERLAPGAMRDFVAHRDDNRDGPLDDLEQRHHDEAGVPGDMLRTPRLSNV